MTGILYVRDVKISDHRQSLKSGLFFSKFVSKFVSFLAESVREVRQASAKIVNVHPLKCLSQNSNKLRVKSLTQKIPAERLVTGRFHNGLFKTVRANGELTSSHFFTRRDPISFCLQELL
jgi:hypothetical protein